MEFPLTYFDFMLWLSFIAVFLLATSEFISPYYGKTMLVIEKNRLRYAAFGMSAAFFISILLQIYLI